MAKYDTAMPKNMVLPW